MSDQVRRLWRYFHRRRNASRVLSFEGFNYRYYYLHGLDSDPEHRRLAVDAIETFSQSPAAQIVAKPETVFEPDAAHLLLHPWPYIDELRLNQLRAAKSDYYSWDWWMGRRDAFILFRNLELWRARPLDVVERKLLAPLCRVLDGMCYRRDARVLENEVAPSLAKIREGGGVKVICGHARKKIVFTIPRKIYFCPDCGMGVSDFADQQAAAGDLYGGEYATGGRFTGKQEFIRYAREQCDRVAGYLKQLGFDLNAPLPSPAPKVLDFGCGNGRYAWLWASRGWRYVGIDISEENVRFARSLAADLEIADRCTFIQGTHEHSILREQGPFDVIFMSHVMEHFESPLGMLKYLTQFTHAGSRLYIEVPNALEYTWSMTHRGYMNEEHISDFTPAQLKALVKEAGWRDARVHLDERTEEYPFIALMAER